MSNFIQAGPLAVALCLKHSLISRQNCIAHTLQWSGIYLKEAVTPSKFLRSLMLNFKLKKNHVDLVFNSKIYMFLLMVMEKIFEQRGYSKKMHQIYPTDSCISSDISMCLNISVKPQNRGLSNFLLP